MTQTDTPQHPLITFNPVDTVALRSRHDGWTAERQRAFLHHLAESACVAESARVVGMSPSAAYALRRRKDADAFRKAWEAALDYAVHRLSEAAFSRCLNGVATPIFFQGEQVGERRRYDERLTQFLLRYRDMRYYDFPVGTIAASFPKPDRDFNAALAKVHDVKGDVV